MPRAATKTVGAGLYLNEAETARRLGISDDKWRMARTVLEKQGLPAHDELLGGRYWPAVRAFFDRRNGLGGATLHGVLPKADGEENLDAL